MEEWYEKELATIQPVKQEAFNLAGSSPKLDALIRQLALKCLCSAPVIYKEWSQCFWQDLFLLYAADRKRTRWEEEYKYTSQVQHADTGEKTNKKTTAGIEHQEFLLSKGRPGNKGTVVACLLIIRYHQSPILICYELETVGQESRSWYLLFSSHLNMFPDEDEGERKRQGSSLEVLRPI